jgi:hypothetical protein
MKGVACFWLAHKQLSASKYTGQENDKAPYMETATPIIVTDWPSGPEVLVHIALAGPYASLSLSL